MTGLSAHPSGRSMFWLIGVTFLLMGMVQASYGPSFPGFEARFHVTEVDVARVYTATFIAMFVSVLLSGPLIRRVGLRATLLGALLLMVLGLALMAAGLNWPMVLLGAFVVGLGYGFVTVVGNFSLARIGARAGLNLANAMFGVGAILAPLAVAWLAPRGVTLLYGLLGVALLLVSLFARAFPRDLGDATEQAAPAGRAPWLPIALFNLLLFLYVAMETSASGWMARHLTPTFGLTRATALVSVFWVAFTLGRIVSAPLAQRVPPGRLAALSQGLCVVFALCSAIPALRLPAYVLLGFSMAPIYMAGVAWLVTRVPERFVNLGLLGSGFGAAFGPPLVGLLLARSGLGAVPLALAAFALLGLLVNFAVRATQPRPAIPSEAAGRA